MTTDKSNENMLVKPEILNVAPEFSLRKSIRTCMFPVLLFFACFYLLVQINVSIDQNQKFLREFFRIEYTNLGYLLSAIYLSIMAVVYITCCKIKYANAFPGKTAIVIYASLAAVYVTLTQVMHHSFEDVELLTRIESTLYDFSLIPYWFLPFGVLFLLIYICAIYATPCDS